MSDKRFDDIIKKAIDQHRQSYDPSHWEQMNQLIDGQLPPTPDPQKDQFDQLLKGKLEGHQVQYNENSWLNLQSTLENEINDQHVDHEVRNRLKHHTVQYRESHWQILKAKLELEKELKKNIFWTKTSEVAIIALLLLSYMHLGPYVNEAEPSPKTFAALPLQIESDGSVDKSSHGTSDEKMPYLPMTNHRSAAALLPAASSGTASTALKAAQADVPMIVEETNNSQSSAVNGRQQTVTNFNTHLPADWQEELVKNNGIPDSFLKSKAKTYDQAPAKLKDKVEDLISPPRMLYQDQEAESMKTAKQSHELPAIIALTQELHLLDSRNNHLNATPVLAKINQKPERWVGVSTGADLNIVKTPIDIDFIKEPRDFVTTGLTNGINYSITKGQNEFFTGIYYSVKIYDPKIKEQIEVNKSYYIRDHVQEKFQIIHLPFQYRRHIGNPDKLHTYLVGGLAVNGVMYAEYSYDDLLKRGDPRPDYALNQAARYRQADFHKGLLDGGHFKHNFYLTAQVGLGIEKRINRMKVFFDAVYKNNLLSTKLGPRDVKLNSVSFNIGTRYKI